MTPATTGFCTTRSTPRPTTSRRRRASHGAARARCCSTVSSTAMAGRVSPATSPRSSRGRRLPGAPGKRPADAAPPLLLLQPCLEHQHVPELLLPVAPRTEMLRPLLAHPRRVEKAFPAQARLVQKLLGPATQRPAQPVFERHREAHLRALDE